MTFKLNLKKTGVCNLEGSKRAVKKKAATLQRQRVNERRPGRAIRSTALLDLGMQGWEHRVQQPEG